MFLDFLHDESGATVLEYGLIVAIISMTTIIVLREVGSQVSATFNDVSSGMAVNN